MTFDDILKNRPLHLQNIATEVRKIILKTDASLKEHVYGGDKIKILLFYIGDKNNTLFGLQLADKHCTLYLHQVDWLSFNGFKTEPNGKNTVSIKIHHPSDVKEEFLTSLFKKNIVHSQKNKAPIQEVNKKPAKKQSAVIKKITLDNPKAIMRKKKQKNSA